jgi:aldehyde:ferredoxin oxidoreductase
MLDAYYEARGWTNEGVPKQAKIKELGLTEYARLGAKD